MATTIGRRYVAAPNPRVSRDTFFKVSTGPLEMPDHAGGGGLEYQIAYCGYPACYEIQCQTSGERGTKTLDGEVTLVQGDPFVVYSSIRCSPVGMSDQQMQTWLADRLEMGIQATVEDVFSQQLCGQAPGLSDNADIVDITTDAVDIVDAIARLENFLYVTSEYGPAGVLHVPLRFAPYFQYLHLLDMRDSRGIYRTANGTAINFGNYAGLDPSGGAPGAGTAFIYITGQTAVYRQAPVFSPPLRDVLTRTTNVVTGVMEQEYIVTFDCAGAGIQTPFSGVVE